LSSFAEIHFKAAHMGDFFFLLPLWLSALMLNVWLMGFALIG